MAILSRIFADKPSRKTTLILSAAGVAALAAGSWIGGGNSPTGALILFAGLVFVIPACTYRWQEIKKFRYLTFSSLECFFVFAVAHNVFEAFAGSTESPGLLRQTLAGLSVGCFLIAILVCPAATLVGIMGWNRS